MAPPPHLHTKVRGPVGLESGVATKDQQGSYSCSGEWIVSLQRFELYLFAVMQYKEVQKNLQFIPPSRRVLYFKYYYCKIRHLFFFFCRKSLMCRLTVKYDSFYVFIFFHGKLTCTEVRATTYKFVDLTFMLGFPLTPFKQKSTNLRCIMVPWAFRITSVKKNKNKNKNKRSFCNIFFNTFGFLLDFILFFF